MASTNKKNRLAAAILGWLLSTQAIAEPGVTPAEIILGQAAGFTGSVAGTVKELTAGAKAYFDRVNATGGVHGRKIVLESLDDGFDPKRTPQVVKQLIDEKQVFALFLSRGTATKEAAYPVLEEAKVPLVGPSTGAMSMYDPPRRYLFPMRPSEPCARDRQGRGSSRRDREVRAAGGHHGDGAGRRRRLHQGDAQGRGQPALRDAVEQQLERFHQEPGRGRPRRGGEPGVALSVLPHDGDQPRVPRGDQGPAGRRALVRIDGGIHRREGHGGGAAPRRPEADAREAGGGAGVDAAPRSRRARRDLWARQPHRHAVHRPHHHQPSRNVRALEKKRADQSPPSS